MSFCDALRARATRLGSEQVEGSVSVDMCVLSGNGWAIPEAVHLIAKEIGDLQFRKLIDCGVLPKKTSYRMPANCLPMSHMLHAHLDQRSLHLLPTLETVAVRLAAEYLHHRAFLESDLSNRLQKCLEFAYERPSFDAFYRRIEDAAPTVAWVAATTSFRPGTFPTLTYLPVDGETVSTPIKYQIPRFQSDINNPRLATVPFLPDYILFCSGNCLIDHATTRLPLYPDDAATSVERSKPISAALALLRTFWHLTSPTLSTLSSLLDRTHTFLSTTPGLDFLRVALAPGSESTAATVPLPALPEGAIDTRGTYHAPKEGNDITERGLAGTERASERLVDAEDYNEGEDEDASECVRAARGTEDAQGIYRQGSAVEAWAQKVSGPDGAP
ncbi:hypothetical protein JCM10207_003814 [Rhodosporidiobolus poonsookiae]